MSRLFDIIIDVVGGYLAKWQSFEVLYNNCVNDRTFFLAVTGFGTEVEPAPGVSEHVLPGARLLTIQVGSVADQPYNGKSLVDPMHWVPAFAERLARKCSRCGDSDGSPIREGVTDCGPWMNREEERIRLMWENWNWVDSFWMAKLNKPASELRRVCLMRRSGSCLDVYDEASSSDPVFKPR